MDRFEQPASPHPFQAQARKQTRALGHSLTPFTYISLGSGHTEAHCVKCDCAVFYGNASGAKLEGTALKLRCDGQGREYTSKQRARALGHTLGVFERHSGWDSAACSKCGCAVILTNDFKPATGTALRLKCADERKTVKRG